jgi:hypothetical protein
MVYFDPFYLARESNCQNLAHSYVGRCCLAFERLGDILFSGF